MAADFDMRKDAAGEWYWVFNSGNGRVICKSTDGYKNRQDCLHSIKLVRELAATVSVWDVSVPGSPVRVSEVDLK